jgi:hypothetical protein
MSQAEVRDQQRHAALANFMRYKVGNAEGFWIGLADIDEEGQFLWQNTAQDELPDSFEAWGVDQPDGESAENCVAVPEEDYFFWSAQKHFQL